jgi:hypothetical protein
MTFAAIQIRSPADLNRKGGAGPANRSFLARLSGRPNGAAEGAGG